jgi:hypothetical protein
VRDAMTIAGAIAACRRRCGRPEEALQLLTPLSPTARRVCAGEELGGFLLELAEANLATGQRDEAAASLAEARRSTADPWLQASIALFESKLALCLRHFTASLAAAEAAETAFVRLRRDRIVATSSRVQAKHWLGCDNAIAQPASWKPQSPQRRREDHCLRCATCTTPCMR